MTRDDIKILEGAIDNYLKMLDILAKIRRRNTMGHLSTEEMLVEMKTLFSDENSQFNKLSEIDMIGAKLAHTFGDEFILE